MHDAGKVERYGKLGVRELWRLHGHKDTWELRAEFLALHPGSAPRKLDASKVLEGPTPADVCEAVEGARFSPTLAERMEAVARVVRRRRQESVRAGEEAPYHAGVRAALRSFVNHIGVRRPEDGPRHRNRQGGGGRLRVPGRRVVRPCGKHSALSHRCPANIEIDGLRDGTAEPRAREPGEHVVRMAGGPSSAGTRTVASG